MTCFDCQFADVSQDVHPVVQCIMGVRMLDSGVCAGFQRREKEGEK